MVDINIEYNQVVWAEIYVKDLERAATFYSEVLQCPFHFEDDDARYAVLLQAQGNGLSLKVNPNGVSTTGPMLYLNCNGHLPSAIEATRANGGEVLTPVIDLKQHGMYTIILDSEGNRVALHSQF